MWRTEIQIDQLLAAQGEETSSTNENRMVLEDDNHAHIHPESVVHWDQVSESHRRGQADASQSCAHSPRFPRTAHGGRPRRCKIVGLQVCLASRAP